MKAIKLLSIAIVLLAIASCGSVYSSYGDKKTSIKGECEPCQTNDDYYRGYGKIEVEQSPGAENDAVSESRDRSRREIIKFIEADGLVVSGLFNGRDPSGKSSSAFSQLYSQQAFNRLNNQEEKCYKVFLIKATRKGPEKIIAESCIEIERKQFNDQFYKDNYEMFSTVGLDKSTFDFTLRGTVKKK